MPASNNFRIFYATHQAGIRPAGSSGSFTAINGMQSIGHTANVNLRRLHQIGQLAVYQNYEDIPECEVTITKLLDGYTPVYLLATVNANAPTLLSRAKAMCDLAVSIFSDESEFASGTPMSSVLYPDMFVSSVTYNFPVDGEFTEEVTLINSDRIWANDTEILNPNVPTWTFNGAFTANGGPLAPEGVNRRQHIVFQYNPSAGLDVNGMVADPDATILPPDVFGISPSGTNEKSGGNPYHDVHITNISVSFDFNRESKTELGKFAPYTRLMNPPIDVTTEIEINATEGDYVSLMEDGILSTGTGPCSSQGNLRDRTIRIATCEGLRVYTGPKNRLASVNQSGGDAEGGDVTITYTFETSNDCTVMHQNDPNTNFSWANRANYLVDL